MTKVEILCEAHRISGSFLEEYDGVHGIEPGIYAPSEDTTGDVVDDGVEIDLRSIEELYEG